MIPIDTAMVDDAAFIVLWNRLHDMMEGNIAFQPTEALLITNVCADYINENRSMRISDSLWMRISQDGRLAMIKTMLTTIPDAVMHHLEQHCNILRIPVPGVN